MRKDHIYSIHLSLDIGSMDIVTAECGCPAGKGPSASCKHIGALCYALAEFSRYGKTPDFLTCTEKLQTWNRPRPRKLDLVPVADLSSRKDEILRKEKRMNSLSAFDPRQSHHRNVDPHLIEKFHCDLLGLNRPCAFLGILVPGVGKIENHTYSMPWTDDAILQLDKAAVDSDEVIVLELGVARQLEDSMKALDIKLALNVSGRTFKN